MVNSSANYWIAANALSISLNALGEPNRCQCGLATGSVIMCYVSGVEGLEYDNGHNYRRWPLTISPTFFNDNAQKYVYVKIPRTSAIGTTAMICWPSVKLSIEGREVLADGTDGEQIGSTDYYYIWLQGIISSSGDNGQTARIWVEPCQSGTLSTDEAINPEGSQWYSWNNITQQVTFLKEIIMSATSRFFNIRLGNHNLTGVAVDATTDADSDHHIVTPAYVKSVSDDRYLRKDQDDYTPYLLGVNRLESNHIQSTEYTGDGMLDAGYKLWYENGRAKLVIDDLVARGKFSVNELESRIWTYAGGNMVFSGAGSTVFYVEYLDGNGEALGYTYVREPWLLRGKMMLASGIAWAKRKQIQRELTAAEKAQVVKFRCYEYSDDGTMQTRNWWRANDLAFCQSLNHVKDKRNSDGSYSGSASNTVFWRRVAGIGSKKIPALNDGRVYDYVDLWNLQNVTGQTYKDTDGSTKTITDSVPGYDSTYNDWPAAGDVIVQRGNAVDVTRQCCVTIEVEGDQLHGFKIYDGINTYSAANTQWVSLGYDLQTGKADAKIYGDCYIGARDQSTYVRYNRTTGVLDIKAKINAQSTMPYNGSDTTLANIFSGINQQIDGKVETWQQDTNPAAAWITETEQAKHVGDLWMDTSSTGGKKTYIYKDKGAGANPRYDWVAQDVPQEVFDGIDGKAAAYASWGAWGTKLHLRDLLIPDTTFTHDNVEYKAGKVYRCTSLNPITFSEINYTDDTKANEVARGLAQEITDRGQAIAAAQQAAAQDATNKVNAAKQELEQSINSVDTAHTTAEGALADGYIDNDEREALKAVLKSLQAEFADVTASYSVVYNNALLNDTTEKTNLYNAYTALVAANNNVVSAFTSFINAPATTKYEKGDSEGSYTYTPAGQSQPVTVNLTTLQTTFNTCAAAYQSALESANAKIQALIKAIADNALNGVTAMQYIKNAIKGTTVTQGGLMLTSAIFLRQLNEGGDPAVDSDYTTWSGINGTTPQGDRSIAAWFGGDMEDKEAAATPDPTVRYAKSLFRMDGSGYVADGGLSWDYNNQGKTVVTLNGDVVKAANYYLNGTNITPQLDALFRMFELTGEGTTASPHKIHAKLALWTEYSISAGGNGGSGGGGGGGGAGAMFELADVKPNSGGTAVDGAVQGNFLQFNNGKWQGVELPDFTIRVADSVNLGGIKIGYTTDATNRNYAVQLSNQQAYVNVPWVAPVQSDWNETNTSSLAYIKNKPTIPTVPTNVSAFTNDSGYITSSGSCNYATSAGSTNKLTALETITYGANYLQFKDFFAQTSGNSPTEISNPTGDWYHHIVMNHGNSAGYFVDMAICFHDDYFYYRRIAGGNANSWVRVIDSSNIGSQSVSYATTSGTATYANSAGSATSAGYATSAGSATDSTKLPLAGGAMNSGARISANGGNLYIGNSNNAGWLMVQDICSQDAAGDTYWSLRTNGNAHVVNLYASTQVKSASDARFKEVVKNAEITVEQIAQMPSVIYRWKDREDKSLYAGTLAQSWEGVLPEVVSIADDKDHTRSFSYGVAALVSAIQDAREIVALKKEIRELKAEIKFLKKGA